MPSFWVHVKKVLKEAEIIIEVLDARLINETRNKELENKIKYLGKKILYVVTKCDLVNLKKLKQEMKNLKPSVFISSTEHYGTTILKKKILEMSRGESVIVGVVGYPNVGKSSLINSLSGRGAARTSSESGYTKGMQKIKVDNKILILDTPGVYPNKEKNIIKHSRIGAVDYSKIKDPEIAALHLIEDKKELIIKHYKLKMKNSEEILEELAFKFSKLAKGNTADLESTAIFLLK